MHRLLVMLSQLAFTYLVVGNSSMAPTLFPNTGTTSRDPAPRTFAFGFHDDPEPARMLL